MLIGMRGSGKSSVGKALAKKRGCPFFDTDVIIEHVSGKTISEIVAKDGWEAFRNLETNVCQKVGERKGSVIAVGGGAILRKENVSALKKNGIFLFLNVPLAVLVQRIQKSKRNEHRPSLTGKTIAEELQEVWEMRKNHYHQNADIVFSFKKQKGVSAQAEEILTLVHSFENI